MELDGNDKFLLVGTRKINCKSIPYLIFFSQIQMPLPDPRAGSLFIWVISCFLLLAILAGGSFLVLYMSLPQTQSTSWLPVAGVLLVCLPWLFWLLTILYRLISRTCGFRMGGSYGGNGVRGGGGSVTGASGGGGVGSVKNAAADEASEAVAASSPVNSPERSGARRVHFGAAVVVGEQDGQGELEKKNENQMRSLSSSNSSNDISINSHESEIPLALSMVS
ncbi:hypothetical protein VitviT2T_005970 [Vitis vinifera]|uniref:Uncharacterized protein n=1 Tax=Vitis vinifera TaxID=29760 RepID=A0ABY9BUE6_VITVI|nr:uncharacterized protein LOC104879176 [Vitis vinifera]WJZ86523.1 hypothetical protein VitviT2T_005970 [Vitis vinifera]|eukprot:XP_010649345.1 PREDICTED: uncharacterized protein LOC104879176 [Vitis vinifera]